MEETFLDYLQKKPFYSFIVPALILIIEVLIGHYVQNRLIRIIAWIFFIFVLFCAFIFLIVEYFKYKKKKNQEKSNFILSQRSKSFDLFDKLINIGLSRNIAKVLVEKANDGKIEIKLQEIIKLKGNVITADVLIKHLNGKKTVIINEKSSVDEISKIEIIINILSRLNDKSLKNINIKLLICKPETSLTFDSNRIQGVYISPDADDNEIIKKLLYEGAE